MAELDGHVRCHQAGHEAGQEDDGADRNYRQDESQPHAPAAHRNQQGRDGYLNQGNHRAGGGDGQFLAPETEQQEQGAEEISQPFHNGGERIQDNAEGGEKRGAGSHGTKDPQGFLHDVGNALSQMCLGIGLIHPLPQRAAQQILSDGLFGVGLHTLIIAVGYLAQRRNSHAHQGNQQGNQESNPEIQVPVALAPEACIGQSADIGKGQQEAHGNGGHTGTDDHSLPLRHTSLLILVVDGNVSHGEIAQKSGHHDHGGAAGELKHRAHDAANQHAHEFHQTIVHQQRQEHRGCRNADADGDQDIIHNKGTDALSAQGIHTAKEPSHPAGIHVEINI